MESLGHRPVENGVVVTPSEAPPSPSIETPQAHAPVGTLPRAANRAPVWRRKSWGIFASQSVLILALGLAPWPGWGLTSSQLYCWIANAVIVPVAPPSDVRWLFRPGDDPRQGEQRVPWQVYVYAQRAETGEVNRFSYKWRMAYVSVATFVALAAASALQRRRTFLLWMIGFPLLLLLTACNDANRALLTVDRWGWISLRPAIEVALSAGYTLLNGLPVIPYVVPAMLWWGLVGSVPPKTE